MGILETYLRKHLHGSDPGKKNRGMAIAEAMIGRFIGLESNEYTEDFDLAISLSERELIDLVKEFYEKLKFELIPKVYEQPIQLKKENVFLGITITRFNDNRTRFTVVMVG
jgi:hypothetical protein